MAVTIAMPMRSSRLLFLAFRPPRFRVTIVRTLKTEPKIGNHSLVAFLIAVWLAQATSGYAQSMPEWLPRKLTIDEIRLTLPNSQHRIGGVEAVREDESLQLSARSIKGSGFGFDELHLPLWMNANRSSDGSIRGVLADRDGRLRLTFMHDGSVGRTTISSNSIEFSPGNTQPATLVPPLADYLSDVDGRVQLDLAIEANDGGSFRLTIDTLSLAVMGVPISEIDAELAFSSLQPLATERQQSLNIQGIELGNLTATMQTAFTATGGLVDLPITSLTLNDSAFEIKDLKIATNEPSAQGLLLINGLDLAALTQQIQLDGLSATGWIGGTLPFVVDANGVFTIKEGNVAAATPGIINYRPAVDPTALAGNDPNILLVRQALENFHFSALRIKLNGSSGGDMSVELSLKGANPDLHGGYPLEFNLSLDGALALLAQQAVSAYQLPDRLSQELLDYLDR